MSHLVNAFPIGRLGNQMFQIAATLGYAKKYNCQWGFPSDTREVPKLREFFPNVPVLDGNFRRKNFADPVFFNYQPLPNFAGDTTLVGFFQSEKYFEGQQAQVRNLFKLSINPNDKVSIHVRRGDYVNHSASFPPVDINYLKQAVSFFREKGYADYLVFSDDPVWCRSVLPDAITKVNFEFSEESNEFNALSLMASCKHNIIANSTFSWWGAWLNPNPEKMVVSPHYTNWFGPGFTGSAPKDLIPYSWHQITFR